MNFNINNSGTAVVNFWISYIFYVVLSQFFMVSGIVCTTGYAICSSCKLVMANSLWFVNRKLNVFPIINMAQIVARTL